MKNLLMLFLMLGLCASFEGFASPFYTESGVSQIRVRMGDTVYKPYIARAKLGYQISDIYAVEAVVGTHVYGDKVYTSEMEIRNVTGLFLRYGSSMKHKLRLYGIAGYAMVDAYRDTPSGKFVKEYRDFAYAIGAEERLQSYPSLSFTLEYARYYSEADDQLVSSINAGIRARLQWF